MGSTITCHRRVATAPSAVGAVFFLFEETYESNVTPKTPRWSCIHVGDAASALESIFSRASSCEGGMLRNRSGAISAEGYIQSWLEEMGRPFVMEGEARIRLSRGEYDWHGLSEKQADAIRPLLSDEEAAALDSGRDVVMACKANADTIARIVSAGVNAWAAIERDCVPATYDDRDASLGYNPASAKSISIERPEAFHLPDGDNIVLQDENGAWRCRGWEFNVVADFIRGSWKTEMEIPGSYRRRIKAFREAIKTAPTLPAGSTAIDNEGRILPVTEESSKKLGRRPRGEVRFYPHTEAQAAPHAKPVQLALFAA